MFMCILIILMFNTLFANISASDIDEPSVYLSIMSNIDNNVPPSIDDVRAFLLETPVYKCGAEDGECRSHLLFQLLKDYPDMMVNEIISLDESTQQSVLREFSVPIQEWNYKEIADKIASTKCDNPIIADLESIMMQLHKDSRPCIRYCYIYPCKKSIELYPSNLENKPIKLDLSKLTEIMKIMVYEINGHYAEVVLLNYNPVINQISLFLKDCWIDLDVFDAELSPRWK